MSSPHQAPADATSRFSDRVAAYVKSRPDYPPGAIALLQNRCGLGPKTSVADVGAGTGIFTRALLATGAMVHTVEPNQAMREALLAASTNEPRLNASTGTADATGLPDSSVDLITAAQAFHWFNREKSRKEFKRILRPNGWMALIWNNRKVDASAFLIAYEQLLQRWATDYPTVNHRAVTAADIQAFFAPNLIERFTFSNAQRFDFEGLRTRLLSSSYAPGAGHPNHQPMVDELRAIFDAYQHEGVVVFEYEMEVYLGRL